MKQLFQVFNLQKAIEIYDSIIAAGDGDTNTFCGIPCAVCENVVVTSETDALVSVRASSGACVPDPYGPCLRGDPRKEPQVLGAPCLCGHSTLDPHARRLQPDSHGGAHNNSF